MVARARTGASWARTRALAFSSALVVCVVASATARAQPAADAQARFEGGQKLYKKRDWAGALDQFRAALAASGSPNARMYVARCLREMGQLTEAHGEMQKARDDAAALAATEKRYAATHKALEAELAELEKRVALLTLTVEGSPPGVEVTLSDRAVPPERLGRPVPVFPGRHRLRVSAPGREPITRELDLDAGKRESLSIALVPVGSDAVGPAPTKSDAPSSQSTSTGGGVRIAGFAVAGAGVAGVILFAVSGSMARSKFDSVEEGCGGVRCTDDKWSGEISTGRTLTTVANVGLFVGLAALAGGGVMIALGGPKEADEASGPSVGVTASPWGGGISVSERF